MQITQGIRRGVWEWRVVVGGSARLLAHVLSPAPSFSLVALEESACLCVCVLRKHTCGYVTCGAASCGSFMCVTQRCICLCVYSCGKMWRDKKKCLSTLWFFLFDFTCMKLLVRLVLDRGAVQFLAG